jgi:hypothetical protein
VGQNAKTTGTNPKSTGTFVPVVIQLKYALAYYAPTGSSSLINCGCDSQTLQIDRQPTVAFEDSFILLITIKLFVRDKPLPDLFNILVSVELFNEHTVCVQL